MPLEPPITSRKMTPVKKPDRSPKNPKPETEVQRATRENALLAAEGRKQTNPTIRQSAMVVVKLPSGEEILKKRHNDADVDLGNVLGRGDRYDAQEMDNGSYVCYFSQNLSYRSNI